MKRNGVINNTAAVKGNRASARRNSNLLINWGMVIAVEVIITPQKMAQIPNSGNAVYFRKNVLSAPIRKL